MWSVKADLAQAQIEGPADEFARGTAGVPAPERVDVVVGQPAHGAIIRLPAAAIVSSRGVSSPRRDLHTIFMARELR